MTNPPSQPSSIMIEPTLPDTCHKCQKAPIENAWPFIYCRSCREELVKRAKAARHDAIQALLDSPNPKDTAYALRAIKRMQEKPVTVVIRNKRKRR